MDLEIANGCRERDRFRDWNKFKDGQRQGQRRTPLKTDFEREGLGDFETETAWRLRERENEREHAEDHKEEVRSSLSRLSPLLPLWHLINLYSSFSQSHELPRLPETSSRLPRWADIKHLAAGEATAPSGGCFWLRPDWSVAEVLRRAPSVPRPPALPDTTLKTHFITKNHCFVFFPRQTL